MTERTADNIIRTMMREHLELTDHLTQSGAISLRSRADAAFSKTLLLSVASYFESRIIDDVVGVFDEETNGSEALVAFVLDKTASRGYSSWFAWDRPNANKFFSAFGPRFRAFMDDSIKQDPSLAASIRAFMELGSLRNELVHQNFAQYPLDKTVDEVFELYETAANFVDRFPNDIRQHMSERRTALSIHGSRNLV